MEWLQDIVNLCGQRCTMIDIGQSYEGRKLPVVKVIATTFVLFCDIFYITTSSLLSLLLLLLLLIMMKAIIVMNIMKPPLFNRLILIN